MGTTYTATVRVNCWKKHHCVDCDCEYRYRFERKVLGQASNEKAAQAAAAKNVEHTLKNDVDVRPCPACGRIQPDMIGQVKSRRHSTVTWLTLLLTIGIVILGGSHAVTYAVAGVMLAGVLVFAMLLHALIAITNPNANLEGNVGRAEQLRSEGLIEITRDGRSDDLSTPRHPMGLLHWLGILAGLLAALVAISPMLAKTVQAWPANEGLIPEVVGPGDTFRLTFPHSIFAVKGYWNGHPTVTVLNPDEVGPVRVTGTGSNNTWGATISGKNVRNQQTHPWVNLMIPRDATLVGKTIKLRAAMTVNFPDLSGGRFSNRSQAMTHETAVTLASPLAGSKYTGLYWLGQLIGGFLGMSAGFFLRSLATALKRQAIPAVVESLGENRPEPEATN